MSSKEFVDWIDYFHRKGRCGPLRLYDRLDHVAALISWQVNRLAGGTGKYEDFLPVPLAVDGHQDSDAGLATVNDVLSAFGGVKRRV